MVSHGAESASQKEECEFMANNYTGSISGVFSTARIFFLVSIVSAHLYFPETFSSIALSRLGTIGVVGFLVMAGYFYRPEKFGSFFVMLKKKATSIGVPWFAMGTITWLYTAIVNPDRRSIIELFKWISGNGTFLYYMPVLIFCFIVFYKYNKTTLVLAGMLNIVSVMLTATGLIEPVIDSLQITNYLNVFNWLGFFAVGMFLQELKEEKLLQFFTKNRIIFLILFGVCYVFSLVFSDVELDYFSYLAIPFEAIGVLAGFSASTFNFADNKLFSKLSASSFTIYLLHMIFIGLLDGFLAGFAVLRLLSPLIIIAISFACLMIGFGISKRLKLDRLYCLLTGLRLKSK